MDSSKERIKKSFNRVRQKLSDDASLVTDLKKLCDQAILMSAFAHEYDFQGVEYNGFRISIDFIIRLFDYGSYHYSGKADQNYHSMVKLFVAGIPYFQNLRDKSKESKCLIDPEIDLICDAFAEYFDHNGMDAGFGPLTGFNYDFPENTICNWFQFTMGIIAGGSLSASLRSLVDPEFRERSIRRVFKNMRVEHIKWIDIIANSWYVRRIAPITAWGYMHPSICKDLLIPRQEEFKISLDVMKQTVKIVHHASSVNSSESQRCRLLYDQGRDPDGTILMHVHGGGFVIGSADNHECYTRSWCNALSGIALFSVDYDLAPETQFPIAIQQILDAYLFLNTSEAAHLIGYKVKKILLIGDSSGALVITSMLCVLSDIRKMLKADADRFILPFALIGIYPSFTCLPRATPSLLLSSLHPELSPPSFLTMLSAYVPFVDQNFNNHLRSNYTNDRTSRLSVAWQWLTSSQESEGNEERQEFWWNQSSDQMKERLNQWTLLSHPYVSPYFYDDMQSLSSVKMRLFACASDPILDQAVEMAKKWKGDAGLHVWPDVLHAFLPYVSCKGKYAKYNQQIISEIKRLADY